MRVAETLVGMREGPNRSHTLDTIPETQDLDLEMVLPNVNIGLGHLPYEEIVDPNATTLHSTPGIDSPGIGMQSVDTEYISPVFGVPPQIAVSRDQLIHRTDILQF